MFYVSSSRSWLGLKCVIVAVPDHTHFFNIYASLCCWTIIPDRKPRIHKSEDFHYTNHAQGPLVKNVSQKLFLNFSTKPYVVGIQKNRLKETVLF